MIYIVIVNAEPQYSDDEELEEYELLKKFRRNCRESCGKFRYSGNKFPEDKLYKSRTKIGKPTELPGQNHKSWSFTLR